MRTLRHLLASLLLLALLPGGSLAAQDLRYVSETDVEFGGSLGVMMRLMPGGGPTTETTSIKGTRMRVDAGDASSVISDVGAGRFTSLDHEGKTYMVFTLDQMSDAMQAIQLQAGRESGTVPVYDTATGARGEVDIDVDVDPTGETKTVHGLDARRVFVTLTFAGRVMVPEEEGGSGEMEDAGEVVLLNDLWLADEFPEVRALADAQREQAEELAGSMRGSGAAMGQVLAANPDLAVAMERQAEELGKLGGMPVESAAYLVAVPPEQDFDREKTLAFATKSLGSQVAGAAANAAVSQAREAAGRAASRIGGMFGRRRQEPEQEEEKPAEQAVLFRVRTRLTGVERTAVPESAFEVPAGYAEQKLEEIR